MKPRILYFIPAAAMLILGALTEQSCYRKFYKVSNTGYAADPAATFKSQPEKYYILRSGTNAFHMEDIALDSSGKSISCRLGRLPEEHVSYLMATKKEAINYKPSKESAVLNEVHIYTLQDNQFYFDSTYVIDFKKIAKIEILEKDKGRTTTSTVISTAGIALFVTSVVLILTSSSNQPPPPPTQPSEPSGESSCPFVSTYNGEGFNAQGELYPGAIYPQLARNDYLQLSMLPVSDGKLQIKISNDQPEVQHTDLAELMVVTHDKNVQLRVDENGKLYSISKPKAPVTATVNNKNITSAILKKDDDLIYAFDDTSENKHYNPVQLTFTRESGQTNAKLLLKVRNAYWIDYVFNKMTQGYGTYYAAFVEKQHSKTADQLKSWMKSQHVPLSVSVLTKKGWKKQEDLTSVGPFAFREIVVPVDLSEIEGNTIHLQVSCGFMFWELDYAAIDFTPDENFTVEKLLPAKAIDEEGNDVTALLSGADEKYLVQPVPGNLTVVDYTYQPVRDENKTQSYVLHAKGYYEYVRDYKNDPDVKFLKQFKNKGALSNYSMALYKQTINGDYNSFAKK